MGHGNIYRWCLFHHLLNLLGFPPSSSTEFSRVMKVAVVHDLAEAVIGDIVPHDTRYTKEEKRRLEEVEHIIQCKGSFCKLINYVYIVKVQLMNRGGSSPFIVLLLKIFFKTMVRY